MNLFKTSLILTMFATAPISFAQNPKSSDAGPGATAGGGTSGEGAALAPNGHSTNKYRASSTSGMDDSTSTSNSVRSNQQAQKKHLNSSATNAAPSPSVLNR